MHVALKLNTRVKYILSTYWRMCNVIFQNAFPPCLTERTSRRALLNLEPLELRRLRFDLTYYYKTLHNLRPFNPDTVYRIYHPTKLPDPTRLTCKSLTMLTQHFYHLSFTGALTHGTICLPTCMLHAPSTSVFKRALKCVDMSRFLKGSSVRQ
jgi:hypothetical protein